MRGVAGSILSAIAAAVVLGGCTTAAPRTEVSGRSPGTRLGSSPGLVLHPLQPDAEADGIVGASRVPAGSEIRRRDADLGVAVAARPRHREWIEVRTVDRRWTSNGRPREHSHTTTRTIRQGVWPAR